MCEQVEPHNNHYRSRDSSMLPIRQGCLCPSSPFGPENHLVCILLLFLAEMGFVLENQVMNEPCIEVFPDCCNFPVGIEADKVDQVQGVPTIWKIAELSEDCLMYYVFAVARTCTVLRFSRAGIFHGRPLEKLTFISKLASKTYLYIASKPYIKEA